MKTKEALLKILADNKGRFISGETLSEKLKISRSAVWKHIEGLRKEGYMINAVTRRGYKMGVHQDVYNRHAIASQLNTTVFGRNLIFYDEIDSTNNELKRLAANGAAEGTVVVAEAQSCGRGRRGRAWNSKPGLGIYMSVLLKPDIAPEYVQVITLAASSAVCSAITPFIDIKPGIKWPNDILIENKKVCGILTEMSAEPEKVHSIIVGIGINVNHREDDFCEELKNTATSLRCFSKSDISRCMLAARVLEELESLYLDFVLNKSADKLLNIWRCFSVTIGYDIIIYRNDKAIKARALDVADNGNLLVQTQDGRRQLISSGEISIRLT
ncbi:MAG TPA: biotin--[acetyl-CoA-carboxylase] ligase [Ruminiclostridium sp.]|jgi:BirA family biotin operon repressor/biotin-[acetyl-CoA-carboxylase] ligase|nr:biotin--[acetyl-CoA-carboxylase] ligase [Clostridiaceae bacterium]HAA25196.1 biotin--[acetyl-CoA-carboxylase] ligase [Ruminiclostridium sp.]